MTVSSTAPRPRHALIEGLRFRIDPAKADDIEQHIGIHVADTGDTIGVTFRNGIVELAPDIGDDAALVFTAPKMLILAMMFRDTYATLSSAVEQGHATIEHGDLSTAQTFFGYFDAPNTDPITLSDR